MQLRCSRSAVTILHRAALHYSTKRIYIVTDSVVTCMSAPDVTSVALSSVKALAFTYTVNKSVLFRLVTDFIRRSWN